MSTLRTTSVTQTDLEILRSQMRAEIKLQVMELRNELKWRSTKRFVIAFGVIGNAIAWGLLVAALLVR